MDVVLQCQKVNGDKISVSHISGKHNNSFLHSIENEHIFAYSKTSVDKNDYSLSNAMRMLEKSISYINIQDISLCLAYPSGVRLA